MYYTKDHEWIDFQHTAAFVGVSNFKLTGFQSVDEVIFTDLKSLKKKGDVVAWLRYDDYKIEILMPVDGRIEQVNKVLLGKDSKKISEHLAKTGWMFSIVPANSLDRYELIPIQEYLSAMKNKFSK
jgi:glycine cleavage system H lipoate-binding protein